MYNNFIKGSQPTCIEEGDLFGNSDITIEKLVKLFTLLSGLIYSNKVLFAAPHPLLLSLIHLVYPTLFFGRLWTNKAPT